MSPIDFSKVNLSYAGCGFLCMYHAGVSVAIREYAPQMTRNRMYGASAGSIAAAGLICNVCISEATSAIFQVVCEARAGTLQALSPTFDLIGLIRDGLERVLPANAHVLCSGRLFISLTRYEDCKNVIVSEFSSKQELIQAIVCSCFIPIFCGFTIPEYKGVKYIDGGFSDNQPIYDERTITISPFSGESDICPMDYGSAGMLGVVYYNSSIRFTTENFYRFCSCFAPPSREICSRICRQGFADALRFLTKNTITPCAKCLTIQSNSVPLPQYKKASSYFSPPSSYRHSSASFCSVGTRRRLDSECEVCYEKLEQNLDIEITTALFPEVMQKMLDETQASEYRLINYILSMKIIKWSMKMMWPVIIPIEYSLVVLKTLKTWLDSSFKTDFFLERLTTFIDLILQEVEEKNLLYSPKFSGQQMNIETRAAGKGTSELSQDLSDECPSDFYSEDSIVRLIEYTKTQEVVLIYHYTDQSDNTQVCEVFEVRSSETSSTLSISHAKPGRKVRGPTDSKQPRPLSLMEEENAEMLEKEREDHSKLAEFTIGTPPRENQKNSGQKPPKGVAKSIQKECPRKIESVKSKIARTAPRSMSKTAAEDSGISLTDDGASAPVKKRDACCSPMRHLGNRSKVPLGFLTPSQQQQKTFTGAVRRHTTLGFSTSADTSNRKASAFWAARSQMHRPLGSASSTISNNPIERRVFLDCAFSSDSDAGDELFVASPRRRTTSNEYDGDVNEPSDPEGGATRK